MKTLILFLVASAVCADPLANLPSSPGATVAQIETMSDNSWLNLGAPAADSAWGRARGRSFSPRMVYCPDKKGIFLCATGVHGAVKPDHHYMDDLWFYDINAHQWICLYPGAGTPEAADPLLLHLDSNGLEVDSLGNAVPVSYLSHGYCNIAYNPDSSFYTIMWTQCPWWCSALPQRVAWLGHDSCGYGDAGPIIPQPKHVLYWDVKQGKWMRKFHAAAGPSGRAEGVAEYLPGIRKLLYKYGTQTWLYDYAANLWTRSAANFPHTSYDYLGCYDSKRNRVYVAKSGLMWFYDVQADKWDTVTATDQPDLGASTTGHLHYDSVNDVLIAFVTAATTSTKGVYAYDYGANAWSKADTIDYAKPASQYDCFNSCYDPDLNAHFLFAGGDSGDNGIMLAYRYKKAASGLRRAGKRQAGRAMAMEISPNPFKSSALIRFAGIRAGAPVRLEAYTLAGEKIVRVDGTGMELTLRMGNIPSGVYVVRASACGQTAIKRVFMRK